jgi:DNA-directed RNA polymerase specialized sigma24 family protein
VPPAADNDALFVALTTLRDRERGVSVLPAAATTAWRTIDAWARARFPRDEDARQAALLAIHRGLSSMQATDALGAAAWARTIVERKRIDAARYHKRRRATSLVEDDGSDRQITGTASVAFSESALTELFAELEAALDQVLEDRFVRPLDRILPRAHARARLLRAMGHGVPEIREALLESVPQAATVSDAAISKWIERGLPLLTDAIDLWEDAGEGERDEMAKRLLERVEMRRADAGKPRHSRRKSAGEAPPSVAGRTRRQPPRRRCAMLLTFIARARFGPAGRRR